MIHTAISPLQNQGWIDSLDWDAMTSEEQKEKTDELKAKGLALVRVWNSERRRDIFTFVPFADRNDSAMLENISSPFEFGIDCEDCRIPGASDIRFIVENHSTREHAQETLLKFIESLKRFGVEQD